MIWAIGWSMIALAGLIWLSRWSVLILGLGFVGLHNTLDHLAPHGLGPGAICGACCMRAAFLKSRPTSGSA